MAINLEAERIFLLSAGPKMVGKSPSSLRDMWKRGRVSESGSRVHLETCLLEGGRGTSLEALQRMRRRLNDLYEQGGSDGQ